MLNQVIIMGNLTANPEWYEAEGKNMSKFTLAVDESKSKCSFFKIICFDNLERSVRYLHKGDRICVTGRLTENTYTNENNITTYRVEIIAKQLEFVRVTIGKESQEVYDQDIPF